MLLAMIGKSFVLQNLAFNHLIIKFDINDNNLNYFKSKWVGFKINQCLKRTGKQHSINLKQYINKCFFQQIQIFFQKNIKNLCWNLSGYKWQHHYCDI